MVEYVVLLALIFIIVVVVVHGVGQRTSSSVAQANDGLTEQPIAARAAAKARPAKPASAGIAPTAAQPSEVKE